MVKNNEKNMEKNNEKNKIKNIHKKQRNLPCKSNSICSLEDCGFLSSIRDRWGYGCICLLRRSKQARSRGYNRRTFARIGDVLFMMNL